MLHFHFWVSISKVSKLPNFQKIVISNNNRFQWNEKNIYVLFLTKFYFSYALNFPCEVTYNQTELFWFAPRSHLKLTFNKVNCRGRAAAIIYLTIDFLSPFVKTRNCLFPFAIFFPLVLCRCVCGCHFQVVAVLTFMKVKQQDLWNAVSCFMSSGSHWILPSRKDFLIGGDFWLRLSFFAIHLLSR